MDFRVAVSVGHLLVVDLTEPVVGGDGSGVGQDQTAYRISDGRVLLHPPVIDLEVVIHQILIVEQRGAHIAHFLPLLTVEDIGFCHIGVPRLAEHCLHAVLDILHRDEAVSDLVLEIRCHPQGQHINHAGVVLLFQRLKCLGNSRADLADLKLGDSAVPLCHLVHDPVPPDMFSPF